MIAVTGGAGSGKSTVLQVLAEQGLRTLDADRVAAEVRRDPVFRAAALEALRLSPSATVEEMRHKVHEDPVARKRLNAALFPPIWQRIVEAKPDAVEIPLLVEAALVSRFQSVWVVVCPLELRMARLEARLGDRAAAERLVAIQLPDRVRAAFADEILRNDDSLQDVRQAAINVLARTK